MADSAGEHQIDLSCKTQMRVGTWNVWSMQTGKLEVIKEEMILLDVAIMRIGETRWLGKGHFNSMGHMVVMSGRTEGRVRKGGSHHYYLQAYASTSEEGERECFYNELQGKRDKVPKGNSLLIMGDFHVKVRKTKEREQSIRGFGLGERNEAGERLIEFCETNEMSAMTTFFEKPDR